MKLSTALRRAAKRALTAGDKWWPAVYAGKDYWEILSIRVAYGFTLVEMKAWKCDQVCTALLLLAEIAEGDGR